MEFDFLLVRISLLCSPILAVVIFFLCRRRFPKQLVIVAASMLLLYSAIALLGLRFVSVRANLAYSVAAYFAYSVLAVSCFRIPQKLIRLLTFTSVIIPIGCSYLLATTSFGVFTLEMVVYFYTSKPNQVEEMAPGLTCRMTEQGMGGQTSSMRAIGLYRAWNWMPLLERKLIGVTGVRDYTDAEEKVVSCADLVARYVKS